MSDYLIDQSIVLSSLIVSLLRYVRQAEDSLNSIVAGAVAGWISIKFCDETLKQEIVLLALSRAIIAMLASYIEKWKIHV